MYARGIVSLIEAKKMPAAVYMPKAFFCIGKSFSLILDKLRREKSGLRGGRAEFAEGLSLPLKNRCDSAPAGPPPPAASTPEPVLEPSKRIALFRGPCSSTAPTGELRFSPRGVFVSVPGRADL
mmetsp:Transcript_37784/g.77075  ORF Transcript_37784/g.77075 Transcript_37784/m.77075 type:complete len:124 (+) Transcript_37784:161-532(+)